MKEKEPDNYNKVDAAIAAIRSDKPGEAEMAAAGDRVRKQILDAAGVPDTQLNSIDDYIAAIPEYLANRLSSAQTLLFEEEVRSSIPLRRALDNARNKKTDRSNIQNNERKPFARWLAAAAAIAAIAVTVIQILPELPSFDQSRLAQVEEIEGRLYQVVNGQLAEITTGTWINGGEGVRTGKESTAILVLDDGSRIEVNGRSELSMTRRPSGNRIDVERGRIIVAASKQGSGTLDVTTDEFIVSVTGTIFEVGHGTMGSLVAVIEGEVEVLQQGDSTSLIPGEQMASRSGFSTTHIFDEISWSRDADQYIAMLKEVSALLREIDLAMETEPRFSTRLLDIVPEGTTVYIGVPNAPEKISEVYELMRTRMQQEGELADIWKNIESEGEDQHLDELMTWLNEVGDHLGDETAAAISLQGTTEGIKAAPVILSEVDAQAFRTTFDEQVSGFRDSWIASGHQDDFEVVLVDDPTDAVSGQLSIWLSEDLLIASTSAELLLEIQSALEKGASDFVGTGFHSLLESAYGQGAEFLGAVHLERVLQLKYYTDGMPHELDARKLENVGLKNIQYLIAERQYNNGTSTADVRLTFDGERTGLMSWLAEPGPMGALEFFSVDATIAAAFVVKDPSVIVDEIEQIIRMSREEAGEILGQGPEFDINIRNNFLATLGGEAAFGLDGPTLPTPSWKVIVEVYNELQLQEGIELAIKYLNKQATERGEDVHFEISSADIGSYSGYQIVIDSPTRLTDKTSVHYAYIDGYLVAAASSALLDKAITFYQSGAGILTDSEFRALLPKDGELDFSAVVFNRLGELIAGLVEQMPTMSPEQQESVKELSREAGPSMVSVYASTDTIRFLQNGSSDLPFGFSQLFSLRSITGATNDHTSLLEMLQNHEDYSDDTEIKDD